MVYKETLSNGYGDRMGIERVIFDAMFCRRFQYLLKLLESGFNPDVVDDNKMTLITHACLFDNPDERLYLAKLLVEHGAVPTRRDRFNMDSLMHATLAAHINVIPLLVEESYGDIDLKAHSSEGYPLLSMAVISGSLVCVELIYDLHKKLGIHVDDVANDKNVTPFMEAKRRDNQMIAQFLQNVARASSLRVDSDGKSITELTQEFRKKQEEVIERRFNEMRLINPPRFRLIFKTS